MESAASATTLTAGSLEPPLGNRSSRTKGELWTKDGFIVKRAGAVHEPSGNVRKANLTGH